MRLEVTRRADLAVRALVALAGVDRLKAADLAEGLGTTAAFVPQVIGALVKRGWIRSDPGPTGGYTLVVSPERVSALDVVEAVDGPTDDGRCVVADLACGRRSVCALHDAWTRARDELVGALDAVTIGDLVAATPVTAAAR